MQEVRLQKFLSGYGVASRRAIEEKIKQGKIVIDGKKALLGQKVTGQEKILIDGLIFKPQHPVQKTKVLAFYKPKGVECTMVKLQKGKTLIDFPFREKGFFPIGRLDKNSQGLFLLTNEGLLANRIMHPRYEHEKEYLVSVREKFSPGILKKFASGLVIDGYKTKPCVAEKVNTSVFRVVLKEGRNRQIRKLCEVCGLTVTDLLRVRIQNIWLGHMKPGKWRILSDTEVKGLVA